MNIKIVIIEKALILVIQESIEGELMKNNHFNIRVVNLWFKLYDEETRTIQMINS